MTTLPTPGELHNPSGIPVSDADLTLLLFEAARAQSSIPARCQQDDDCEACNNFRLVWWDHCNALNTFHRVALQSALRYYGIPLPEAPWEDIDPLTGQADAR